MLAPSAAMDLTISDCQYLAFLTIMLLSEQYVNAFYQY
jgi:hypothetical protein